MHDPVMPAGAYFEKLLHGTDEVWKKSVYRRADASFTGVLDHAVSVFEEEQRLTKPLVFDRKVLLEAEEGNGLFFKSYRSMPYNRRVRRIKRLIASRLKDARDHTVRRLQKDYERKIKEAKMSGQQELANRLRYEGNEKLRQYMQKVREYRIVLRQVYSIPDVEDWYRERILDQDPSPWIEEDLWAMLYVAAKFHGKGLFDVKHLVVDEAQDVSALGLAALLKVTGTESLTIVGDVRQKIKGQEYPSLMDEWQK